MDQASAVHIERRPAAKLDVAARCPAARSQELPPNVAGASQMSDARSAMLGRIRAALGRQAGQNPPALPSPRLQTRNLTTLERVELFVQQFLKLNGKPVRVRSRADAAAAVRDLINGQTA